jgi:hypothetical protein
MSFKQIMEPLDRLFTLFFVFSPIVIGIFTSFGLDVRLLWVPMGVLFFWALYIYQYRAVYQLSHNKELSLIERMRGLFFFFTFPVLAIITAIGGLSSFSSLPHRIVLGIVAVFLSLLTELMITRAFFEKETALFDKSQEKKLRDVISATFNVVLCFTLATITVNSVITENFLVALIMPVLISPLSVIAYHYEKKSRRLAVDLAISLEASRWLNRLRYSEKKRRKRMEK